MKGKRRIMQGIFFAVVTIATLYLVCVKQDMYAVLQQIKNIHPLYVLGCLVCGFGFVGMEGIMIWRAGSLLHDSGDLLQSIGYSFVGFFYSGITPSATGGQPMQLYYMCKDGRKGANATAILTMVGLFYKAVLVLVGCGIAVVWQKQMQGYLKNYYFLYWFGLGLNTVVVLIIVGLMLFPEIIEMMAKKFLDFFGHQQVLEKKEKVHEFIENYKKAAKVLRKCPKLFAELFILTMLQRLLVFLIPAWIYLGFGLSGNSVLHIVLLQAAIYLAVDLLPLPGEQGITELMYHTVMFPVFGKKLMSALVLTRFFSFYLVLIAGFVVSIYKQKQKKKHCEKLS